MNRFHLILLAVCVLSAAGHAQFTDTFSSLDPAWVTNRYDPAGFESVQFDGDNRLRLTIAATDSAANRPHAFSDAFYNTQGRARPGDVLGLWSLSAQVFVSSTFNTTTGPLVHSALWGHTGTTNAGGDYLILGFTNTSPTDPLNPAAGDRAFRFHAVDTEFGDLLDLGVPAGFVFDTWHTLTGTFAGGTFDYFIDGALVYSRATAAGDNLLSAMVQGYNFGQPASYSVYWDDVTATAIPEPAAATGVVAGLMLVLVGVQTMRKRRAAS